MSICIRPKSIHCIYGWDCESCRWMFEDEIFVNKEERLVFDDLLSNIQMHILDHNDINDSLDYIDKLKNRLKE